MNQLFTRKARIILFSLLICQLGLKAQTTGAETDTIKAKKPDTSFALKADTSLAVKAGSTLVIKSDTMLVINADTAALKRAETALAQKVDALNVKSDSSAANKADPALVMANADTTKKAKAADVKTPAVITPPSDGVIQVKNSKEGTAMDGIIEVKDAGSIKTKDTTATLSQQISTLPAQKADNTAINPNAAPAKDPAATPPANTDAADTKKTDPALAPPAAPPADAAATAPKADSTATVKADTSLAKKADTTQVKTDTTIVQKADTAVIQHIKAENVFLEFGGPGLAISGNYDARFKKERNGWGYRIGAGYFASGGNNVFTIPFQVNYLIGESSHMLELGAGTTFLNSKGTNKGNSKWEFDNVTGFIATATIGYRFQPAHSGINVRVAFVPILYDEGLVPAGGISVGYTFK